MIEFTAIVSSASQSVVRKVPAYETNLAQSKGVRVSGICLESVARSSTRSRAFRTQVLLGLQVGSAQYANIFLCTVCLPPPPPLLLLPMLDLLHRLFVFHLMLHILIRHRRCHCSRCRHGCCPHGQHHHHRRLVVVAAANDSLWRCSSFCSQLSQPHTNPSLALCSLDLGPLRSMVRDSEERRCDRDSYLLSSLVALSLSLCLYLPLSLSLSVSLSLSLSLSHVLSWF